LQGMIMVFLFKNLKLKEEVWKYFFFFEKTTAI